jgi:hypothetical protein
LQSYRATTNLQASLTSKELPESRQNLSRHLIGSFRERACPLGIEPASQIFGASGRQCLALAVCGDTLRPRWTFFFQVTEIKSGFGIIKYELDPSLVLAEWLGDACKYHRRWPNLPTQLFVVACAVQFLPEPTPLGGPVLLWDGLALGGVACFLAYVIGLRIFAAWYLAEVGIGGHFAVPPLPHRRALPLACAEVP